MVSPRNGYHFEIRFCLERKGNHYLLRLESENDFAQKLFIFQSEVWISRAAMTPKRQKEWEDSAE
jgi:hypothetical protein